MKKLLNLIAAISLAFTAFGQSFEGKIVYNNAYKSKMPGVTDEQFTAMMGTEQQYFIKHGNYKSVANGSFFQWQLYVNSENKLYNKMANSETVLWNDGAVNADEVLKAEINKGVTTIAGYLCDELVLTCKTGIQKYYFAPKLSIDPQVFEKHKFGNWYDYVSRTKSMPLKMILDNEQFSLESTAGVVQEMKLEKELFDLPSGTATAKSPY